ncbi:S8 family serine peptidase [Campylobacter sp. M4]|uniref:S8 family serine peptidase n=1 Tax=Campylobacter sp. M4 TaxID=3424761 RepID=UPI003D334556
MAILKWGGGSTTSWESAEYSKYWGLKGINASTAYALGFTGKGVKIGVVDSGALLSHPEFIGRVFGVNAIGVYSKDGFKHPDASIDGNRVNAPINKSQPVADGGGRNYDQSDKGEFKKGEAFNIDGDWIYATNDNHGTHVTGTIGAARDGKEMHGVAFESEVYVGNHGTNDNITYGANLDYNLFYEIYNELAKQGVKFVNNSWGSNPRLNSSYNGAPGYKYKKSTDTITEPSDKDAHIYIKDLEVAKKAYYQFIENGNKNFLDAAYDVAKANNMVQVFTTGNQRKMTHPFTRAILPYFRPDIENLWVAVTGIKDDDKQDYNYVGASKWWGIAAPGNKILSTVVDVENEDTYGTPTYQSKNGTSMAAPHVTGALGVMAQRYDYMTPQQIREVMLTTARQTKSDGVTPLDNFTAQHGTPDEIWGWGALDLGKAMFGPGQFLGEFNLNLSSDDTWSNDISDKAIKFRKTEDETEAAEWVTRKAVLDAKSALTEHERLEKEFETARATAREARTTQGYEGALTKNGSAELILTGDNTFTGKTTINEGKISALNQSLSSSKLVIVKDGAELEILSKADIVKPTATGLEVITKNSDNSAVTATLNSGATLAIGENVRGLNITYAQNSVMKAALDISKAEALQDGSQNELIFTGNGTFVGQDNTKVFEYALFKTEREVLTNSQVVLKVKKLATMSEFAKSENEKRLVNLANTNRQSELYKAMMLSTKDNLNAINRALAKDDELAARQNELVHTILLKNALATSSKFKRTQLDDGLELWSTTLANKISSRKNGYLQSANLNTTDEIIGVNVLNDGYRFGIFLGGGKEKVKLIDNKANTRYFGVMGDVYLLNATLKMGILGSNSDVKSKEAYLEHSKIAYNSVAYNKKVMTSFVELALSKLNLGGVSVEPYLGAANISMKIPEINTSLYTIKANNQNTQVATAGVRPSVAFGSITVVADVAYNQILNNKNSIDMYIKDIGETTMKDNKAKNLTTIEFGVEAKPIKNLMLGIGYSGAFNDNSKSHGAYAKVKFGF